MPKTFFIQTFGCQQNVADSERIESYYNAKNYTKSQDMEKADHVVINTCMIREKAENRVYGLVHNLGKNRIKSGKPGKIIVTGCMVGMALRDKTGKYLKVIRKRMPQVDEFLPIEEIGFDHEPIHSDMQHAWVPISNGCNNFCTFCVVPFTRGREISRPFVDVVSECRTLVEKGFKKITLLGMNVNSYGADLIFGPKNIQVLRDTPKDYFQNTLYDGEKVKGYKLPDGKVIKPVFVKHLNRLRIPTLFPQLLTSLSEISGLEYIDFISSNPWDFSDELIEVIGKNSKITRSIHLPVQSGSNSVLKRMNRWYSKKEYIDLVAKIRKQVKGVRFSTDIIVGFCRESKKEFLDTVDLARKVGFYKAYISIYSDRPMTAAHKSFADDVPHSEKKRRWQILEDIINKPNLLTFKNK